MLEMLPLPAPAPPRRLRRQTAAGARRCSRLPAVLSMVRLTLPWPLLRRLRSVWAAAPPGRRAAGRRQATGRWQRAAPWAGGHRTGDPAAAARVCPLTRRPHVPRRPSCAAAATAAAPVAATAASAAAATAAAAAAAAAPEAAATAAPEMLGARPAAPDPAARRTAADLMRRGRRLDAAPLLPAAAAAAAATDAPALLQAFVAHTNGASFTGRCHTAVVQSTGLLVYGRHSDSTANPVPEWCAAAPPAFRGLGASESSARELAAAAAAAAAVMASREASSAASAHAAPCGCVPCRPAVKECDGI